MTPAMWLDDSHALTAEEAATALADADRLRRQGRRVVSRQLGRLPLIWWGLAWMVTYPAAQFLPLAPAMAVSVAAGTAAFTLTRVGRAWDPVPGSTGWEARVSRAWWAVLAAGFLADVVVAPAPVATLFLVPGVFWGLALLLFAVVAGDLPLGLLGGGIAVLAAAAHLVRPDQALVLFGCLGGGGMVALGGGRVLRSARSL